MKKLQNNSPKAILINQETIPYQIRFSKKAKYLQLRINHSNGLELVIPKRYSLNDGEKFLNEKKDWVKKYAGKIKKSETDFFYLGEKIKILLNYDLFVNRPQIKFENKILQAKLPSDSNYSLMEIYLVFLKKHAKKYFIARTNFLANKFDFKINKISIRGQKTRWGSCTSSGKLSFNLKLLRFRKEVIDYVIIHELCHTKEMNHSKKFWTHVKDYCPEYKSLRKELKS